MDGGELVYFASQLLVGLLIESPIFAIDSNDPCDDFNKIHLLCGEVSRLERLDADDSYQPFYGAEENDRNGEQPPVLLSTGTRFNSKIRISESILYEQRTTFVGYPATIPLIEVKHVVYAAQWTRSICSPQRKGSLQFVIIEDRTIISP